MKKIIILTAILMVNFSIFSTELSYTGNIIPNFTQHNSNESYGLFSLSITWDGLGSLNDILFDESLERQIKDADSNISNINTMGIFTNLTLKLPIIPDNIKTGVIFNIISMSCEYPENNISLNMSSNKVGVFFTYNLYNKKNVSAGITSGFIYENNIVESELDFSLPLEIEKETLKLNYTLNTDTFTFPALLGVKFRPYSFLGITLSSGGNYNFRNINDSLNLDFGSKDSLIYRALKDRLKDMKHNEIERFTPYTSLSLGLSFNNFGLEFHTIYWADSGNITISTNYVLKI